jgi:hypothetical protein
LSGNVNVDELLKEEHLQLLERRLGDVVFAFLAFHPWADSAVLDYVEGGTLASDSGPDIMVLFTVAQDASMGSDIDQSSFADWLKIDAGEQPSYVMIRELFEPASVPPLPGIAFFERFTSPSEVVYFDLASLDRDAIRQRMREIFSLAGRAARVNREQPGRSFADVLAVSAQRERRPFARSGPVSMRQWLVKSYQFAGDHFGDIVSVVPLL